MMNEKELLEQKEMREQMIGRVEVLDKVKELILLPNTEYATVQQVAEYYEVEKEVIDKQISLNREEVMTDGVKNLSGKETRDFLVTENISITNFRGYFMAEGQKFANRNNIFLPRRAILRIGMLLRDSSVAKEVRNYLLNIEENITEEQKEEVITNTIDTEKSLLLEVICAESDMSRAVALNNYKRFVDEEISKRDIKITGLVEGILTWDSRKAINKMIRIIATKVYSSSGKFTFAKAWGELKEEMLYKHSINITARIERSNKKKATLFDVLNADELKLAVKSCIALCEDNDIDISDLKIEE